MCLGLHLLESRAGVISLGDQPGPPSFLVEEQSSSDRMGFAKGPTVLVTS